MLLSSDPHIDSHSRAIEAVRIIADTIDGHVTPTMALAKPPIIPLVNMQFTARGLAREFMEQLSALEHAAEPTPAGTAPPPVAAWSSGRGGGEEEADERQPTKKVTKVDGKATAFCFSKRA